jgi:hypothetical protein
VGQGPAKSNTAEAVKQKRLTLPKPTNYKRLRAPRVVRVVRFERRLRGSRKAVSPVLAELLLIVVALIAGVLVGSFGFQLIGIAAHPAEVTAQLNSCAPTGSNVTCSLTLANVGASNVGTSSLCAVGSAGGDLVSGGTVPAGGTLQVDCSVDGMSAAPQGILVTGWIALSNGADVYFAGQT